MVRLPLQVESLAVVQRLSVPAGALMFSASEPAHTIRTSHTESLSGTMSPVAAGSVTNVSLARARSSSGSASFKQELVATLIGGQLVRQRTVLQPWLQLPIESPEPLMRAFQLSCLSPVRNPTELVEAHLDKVKPKSRTYKSRCSSRPSTAIRRKSLLETGCLCSLFVLSSYMAQAATER